LYSKLFFNSRCFDVEGAPNIRFRRRGNKQRSHVLQTCRSLYSTFNCVVLGRSAEKAYGESWYSLLEQSSSDGWWTLWQPRLQCQVRVIHFYGTEIKQGPTHWIGSGKVRLYCFDRAKFIYWFIYVLLVSEKDFFPFRRQLWKMRASEMRSNIFVALHGILPQPISLSFSILLWSVCVCSQIYLKV